MKYALAALVLLSACAPVTEDKAYKEGYSCIQQEYPDNTMACVPRCEDKFSNSSDLKQACFQGAYDLLQSKLLMQELMGS